MGPPARFFFTPMTTVDLAKIASVVTPVVAGHGLELVDVEWKHESGSWILRVYIDRPGSQPKPGQPDGVGLNECADVSRELGPVLDVADLIRAAYNLEVSSPGLDRPLRTEAHFARFVGHKAKIKTRRPIGENRRNFSGPIVAVDAGVIKIDVGDKVCEVPVAEVEKANLVYEF